MLTITNRLRTLLYDNYGFNPTHLSITESDLYELIKDYKDILIFTTNLHGQTVHSFKFMGFDILESQEFTGFINIKNGKSISI